MTRALPFLLLLLAFPAPAAGLELFADVSEVELGRGFGLSVTRPADGDGDGEWDDARLAPLSVRLIDATRSGDVEVRRYRAWAFVPGELTVDPGDGASPLLLRVVATVDAADPGPAEFPGGPFGPASGLGWPWFVAILFVVAGVAVWFRRRKEAPAVPIDVSPEPEAPAARETALARLAALRGIEPASHDQMQAWFVEVSGIVREYLGRQLGVRTDVMTTSECLGAESVAALESTPRTFVAAFLGRCDEVKFARRRPDGPERTDLLDRTVAFVRSTGGGGA